MLKDSLYKIITLNQVDGTIEAVLEIDKANKIFEGHFPGQPILPGACMLQMVKEILEFALNLNIRLKKAGQMKFIAMIDPTKVACPGLQDSKAKTFLPFVQPPRYSDE